MGSFLRNVRYAVRVLAGTPGFTVTVVLTLALGIGANSAVFSAIDADLLRPLPFPDGDRLVRVSQVQEVSGETGVSPVRLPDWNRLSSAIESCGTLDRIAHHAGRGCRGNLGMIPIVFFRPGDFFDINVGTGALVGVILLVLPGCSGRGCRGPEYGVGPNLDGYGGHGLNALPEKTGGMAHRTGFQGPTDGLRIPRCLLTRTNALPAATASRFARWGRST